MKKFLAVLLTLLTLIIVPVFAQDTDIELTFVHIFDDDRAAVIDAIIAEFEAQNPGVTVTHVGLDNYDDVYNAAVQAADQGTAYNIVQVVEYLTQQAADSGYFVPVSSIATDEQLATLDDFLPPIINYYSIGEEVWSLPWNSSNPILYYNRGVFEQAGLDPDMPPTTFAEITEACAAIMPAVPELAGCINWPMSTWFVEQWVVMENELLVNNGNGREGRATEVLWDSEGLVGIVEWWGDLAEAGYYIYTGTVGDDNGEGIAFLSRQTAMTIASTAGLTLISNFAASTGLELGVAPLPLPNEEATNGVTVGGASVWLSADQTEEELAAANDFIFFLTNTANDMLWHQGTGYMPNRFTSIEALEAEGWFETNPFFAIAVNQLAESEDNLATSGGLIGPADEVGAIMIAAFQSVVDNGADALEALQAAKERADAVLADYNSFFE